MAKPRNYPRPRSWQPGNLRIHYDKHVVGENPCLQDVLGKQPISEDDYRQAATDTCDQAWYVYRAREDGDQTRTYYVDDREMKVSAEGKTFITCYHFHPAGIHVKARMNMLPGERRTEYRKWQDEMKRGKDGLSLVDKKGRPLKQSRVSQTLYLDV